MSAYLSLTVDFVSYVMSFIIFMTVCQLILSLTVDFVSYVMSLIIFDDGSSANSVTHCRYCQSDVVSFYDNGYDLSLTVATCH